MNRKKLKFLLKNGLPRKLGIVHVTFTVNNENHTITKVIFSSMDEQTA